MAFARVARLAELRGGSRRVLRYHTAADTADTLDYARKSKVVQGVYCAVNALAR
ncbi:MAG: hypothetical protein WBV82_05045 [Myxococcaceae bacterium]